MSTYISINNNTFELAQNLRVAYEIQGQMNHTPYMDIFSKIGDMTIEDQLKILYVAFKVKNPEEAKTLSFTAFMNAILDNPEMNVSAIMQVLKGVMSGILGKNIDEESNNNQKDNTESGNE